MKSIISISEKLRYSEKPVIKLTDTVSVEVNNKAVALLEASELASANINKGAIDKMMELLYSEEDRVKIMSLDLTMEDFMTVVSESIAAAVGKQKN